MPDLNKLLEVLLLRGVIDKNDYDYIYGTISEAQWREMPFEFKKGE